MTHANIHSSVLIAALVPRDCNTTTCEVQLPALQMRTRLHATHAPRRLSTRTQVAHAAHYCRLSHRGCPLALAQLLLCPRSRGPLLEPTQRFGSICRGSMWMRASNRIIDMAQMTRSKKRTSAALPGRQARHSVGVGGMVLAHSGRAHVSWSRTGHCEHGVQGLPEHESGQSTAQARTASPLAARVEKAQTERALGATQQGDDCYACAGHRVNRTHTCTRE